MTAWPYGTPEWRALRPVVLTRDGHACVRCSRHDPAAHHGRGGDRCRDCVPAGHRLLIDHVIPYAFAWGGAVFAPGNLQTLCSRCSGQKDGPRSRQRRPGQRRRGMRPVR